MSLVGFFVTPSAFRRCNTSGPPSAEGRQIESAQTSTYTRLYVLPLRLHRNVIPLPRAKL